MSDRTSKLCALALAGSALSPAAALAQASGAADFAPPVRLKAGEKFLGERRLYPSPVFRDMNGDGLADIVVGDLRGRLTVALRQPSKDAVEYGAETSVLDREGKEIDFHNW